jgi:phosphotransacetylase
MNLLRRIAIGNGNQIQKDAATAAIAQREQQIIANWNKELEEEVWQKIVEGIKRSGYAGAGKDNTAKTSSGRV